MLKVKIVGGEYLFTIDSTHSDPNIINTSVSEVPSEHKQHNFGKLDNGQFFAQPNNRMLWFEQSLTPSELKKPDFQVSSRYYFCEQEEKWAFGDSDDYFYKEVRRNEIQRKRVQINGKISVFNKDKDLDFTKQPMFLVKTYRYKDTTI